MDTQIFLTLTSGYHWLGICGTVISIGAALMSSTYVVTTCRFFIGSLINRQFKGKQPLTVPYWIPFMGSAIFMANDAHGFYESAVYRLVARRFINLLISHV